MRLGVTIFIPLYNEADILEDNVMEMMALAQALERPFQILLGSNGSSDRTPAIGNQLAAKSSSITFFHLLQKGPGLAMAEAIARAAYPFFVCLDADLSVDLNFILQAIGLLNEYDAVVGSKQTGSQDRPVMRVLASNFFIACTNLLLKMPYRDYSIGAKAYRIEAIRPFGNMIDRHTFYTQKLLYHLQRSGKRIIEIPVDCRDRRPSKFNLLHEGVYRFSKLFQLWFTSLWK